MDILRIKISKNTFHVREFIVIKKIIYGLLGFGLGAFMLFNSAVCFYRFHSGYENIPSPDVWLASFIVTLAAGLTLITFSALLIRKD